MRAPTLQEVPTLEDAGYKGVVLDAWYAAFVPKGTPPEIVARLNKEMNDSLKDQKLLTNFTTGAVEPLGGTPEEIGKLAQADSVKYGPAGERAQHQDQLSRVGPAGVFAVE